MSNKKLVIFDLDGVLVESRNMHFHTLNQALRSYGYPEIEYVDHLENYNGLPTRVKLEKLGVPKEDQEKIWKLKQFFTGEQVADFVECDERIFKIVSELYNRKIILAVASNAVYSSVVKILAKVKLLPFISTIAAGDQYEPKPSPNMYIEILNRFNDHVRARDTLIIEDSPIGLEAAAKTGIKILKVSSPNDLSLPLILKELNEVY